jgi:hypothetical protein
MLAFVFFVNGSTAILGIGHLTVEVSRSHSDTQKLVILLGHTKIGKSPPDE